MRLKLKFAVSCSRAELIDMKLIAVELSRSEGRVVTLGQALRRVIDTYRQASEPASAKAARPGATGSAV